ncbi:AraC family transcriptional regulator [Flectobacillus major]|uniref:AraC family transcriptional regulator n=1 Tax=Flectobacillus major TaxID=103 RepID=UPI0004248F2F|nr:AraC family transcriptional regulator [Flectobacillus major]
MDKKYAPQTQALTNMRQLQTLVEHRSTFSLNHCELNIFETHQKSERVSLKFDNLVFTAMLRGKKVMNLFGNKPFEYLPGESVVVPSHEEMIIDFPEASLQSPTQCIALAIDKEKIKETIDLLNEKYAKVETHESWNIDLNKFHIKNSLEMANTIDRLVYVSKENNVSKDIFANFALQELLLRLMQTQARVLIFDNYMQYINTNRFAHVVRYIKENLAENLTIEKLSDMACMSKAHFFRSFKREFGLSPVEYIIQERVKLAKKILADPMMSITDASFRVGFQNVNYFCTIFKKYEGTTPTYFKKSISMLKAS